MRLSAVPGNFSELDKSLAVESAPKNMFKPDPPALENRPVILEGEKILLYSEPCSGVWAPNGASFR